VGAQIDGRRLWEALRGLHQKSGPLRPRSLNMQCNREHLQFRRSNEQISVLEQTASTFLVSLLLQFQEQIGRKAAARLRPNAIRASLNRWRDRASL
jgi:hypothetical protein